MAGITEAMATGRRVDPKLLSVSLGRDAQTKLGESGATVGEYIARLAAEATTIINAPDYARVIRDLADQKRISGIGSSLVDIAPTDPERLAEHAIDRLDAILATRAKSNTPAVSMAQAATSAVDAAALAYQADGKITGITWGVSALDRKTLGLQRGELTILAGRPGMGKTALGICVARKAAEAEHKSLFFSLEMGDAAVAQRAMADSMFDSTPMTYWLIRSGKFPESSFPNITSAAKKIAALPIKIEQQPGLTIAQITARARQQQRRHGLDFLIVDHLHLIRASDRYSGHRVEEIGETTRGLKSLAKELGVPVLALCQLSRGVEGRDDKRPTLADLRGSGDIEQDADTVLMLYREAYYLERGKPDEKSGDAFAQWLAKIEKSRTRIDVIVEKQRNGPIGTVPLFCSIAHNAIRDLVRDDQPNMLEDFE